MNPNVFLVIALYVAQMTFMRRVKQIEFDFWPWHSVVQFGQSFYFWCKVVI